MIIDYAKKYLHLTNRKTINRLFCFADQYGRFAELIKEDADQFCGSTVFCISLYMLEENE